ncbi:MAG: hypothetical protein JW937_02885, partial [Candidatus Omnitrophica bacterium]|nr:hypothetical protein [Candidatus Omnitrophota bacterium]
DAFGLTVTTGNATDPAGVDVVLSASLSFPTVAGEVYSLESSEDGINWTPVDTIVGDGSPISLTDVAGFDASKLYRIIAQ